MEDNLVIDSARVRQMNLAKQIVGRANALNWIFHLYLPNIRENYIELLQLYEEMIAAQITIIKELERGNEDLKEQLSDLTDSLD